MNIGLLRRNRMLPAPQAPSDPLWRPTIHALNEANSALNALEDAPLKRFSVEGTRATPAAVHLRKMVKPIVGATVDRLPGPAAAVFSSLVHVLSEGAMSEEVVTRWLELLLEAVFTEDQGLGLVPESHSSRMFRAMGVFVKVCDTWSG